MTCEADFQTAFTKWLKNRHKTTGVFELKFTLGKSIPFSAVADHQLAALLHSSVGTLAFKIPDGTLGQKPFDCFCVSGVSANIVVMFYERGKKDFYMIPIGRWNQYVTGQENDPKGRKSLTEEAAAMIGDLYHLY